MLLLVCSVLVILPVMSAKACSKDGKPCMTRNFKNVSVGNQAVRPSNLISSHNVHRLGECMILCFGQNNCYGFNFRERPSSIYTVNCQLSNSSVRMNMTRMKNGPWVYYEDIMVTQSKQNYEYMEHLYYENSTSCASLYKAGHRHDGVYTINPDGLGSFLVWCDMQTDGGGWTMFQRRQDASVDFYRVWQDYKNGFGDLNGNFWFGLEKIHRLTKFGQNILRVDLMDFNNETAYAKYGTFSVASESEFYKLEVGSFSGNAGDSLSFQNGMKFTTKDKDNDQSGDNCAVSFKGGWWYNNCHNSNLNGVYITADQRSQTGIIWRVWKGYDKSMKKTEMKIRPAPV